MAFIDSNMISGNTTVITFNGAKARAVQFAHGMKSRAMSALSVKTAEDDVFSCHRLRASQLPEIDSCQSHIFSALRQREETRTRKAPIQSRGKLFGLTDRLGTLFNTAETFH